ncbi:hypothetical protein J437_LFUL016129 [Ladona fulva]|uniref:PiggyBac transposable element-derived protein domain-containing protein n=1 Tax=Ladona fulva TaxID=123851 RepID=A0A8K0KIE6_LADFU|nr:hypothetical protein J437_LFUL016129 [Ladona fulva]
MEMDEDSVREDTDEVLVFAEKQIGDGEDCITRSHVASPTLLPQPSTSKDTVSFEWSEKSPQQSEVPFKGSPGLKVQPEGLSPFHFFQLVFCTKLMQHIVDETNKYAKILSEASSLSHARIKNWKDLTVEEFKVFLGVLYHTGTIRINYLSDYWRKDKFFSIPFFSNNMSRDRFLLILQALHFSENPKEDEPVPTDRLYKIRPFLNIFEETMSEIYSPRRELCINESMILWRGRLLFKQYLKGKRHKYGIKVYMLAESSGIVMRQIVYTGAGDPEVGGAGHVDCVVMKLLEKYKELGHSVYMDNYFNSVNLVRQLKLAKLQCTGTLRKNRKNNPKDVIAAELRRDEHICRWTDDEICVLKWKDKTDILMISSEHGDKFTSVKSRRGVEQKKTNMIVEYNKYMGGG